jgi:alkylation response protein AidB-like acyl-CoA dehydrogenase
MDLGFSDEQELIRESAREFFEKECPRERVRELKQDPKGYDPIMWQSMVDLGYTGLAIPEEFSGTEGEFLDLVAFMEEVGRNIAPSPFFATVVLCAFPILHFGTHQQKQRTLPAIASGGEIWSLALNETSFHFQSSDIKLRATLQGETYLLNGRKLFVPYGHVAKHFLVVARTGEGDDLGKGITLFMVEADSPGIQVRMIPTTAHDMRYEVHFDQVKVSENNILGAKDKGWDVVEYTLQHGAILKCAEMLGGAQAVLDLTTRYIKQRVQFNKPIGSFQALQHRMVDLFSQIEGLKYLVYEGAWSINIGSPSKMLISMAKAKANRIYQQVCFDGMIMHGAIGFTEEMDIGLYHLRTKAMEFDCGGTDFHNERIATELENYQPDFLFLKQ